MNATTNSRQMSAGATYVAHAIAVMPRLLALLDREPQSASFGSFDREHWGWKFRDFPLTMLQTAIYPLALLWRHAFSGNSYYRQTRLLGWIEAGIKDTCGRQHRNGAFDSVAPYTLSNGVTLAIVHCLTEVLRVLGDDLSSETVDLIRVTARRACEFALPGREDYAFVSNHHALFALAWLNAAELFHDAKYEKRAEETIDDVLRHQSSDGWYCEYGGADPGYESLGILYLAKYWQRTRSPRLLESLRRSIDFYSHCVHPDGSVGGAYGSRHTQLYFPAGFEILAAEVPLAASIAAFLRERIVRGNVLTLPVSDPENLACLASAYLEAGLACKTEFLEPPLGLPCESLLGCRRFLDSGLVFIGTHHYYAAISTTKGGVCRIFDRKTQQIAYEDSGYVVAARGRRWSSQHLGLGKMANGASDDELVCEAVFSEIRQELPTPAKFLLLRLLNLTLFRNRAIGEWLQAVIIRTLIRKAKAGPLRLRRSVNFGPEKISFRDQIDLTKPIRIRNLALPRSFLSIHMGSAKYFHPSELVAVPEAPLHGMAGELNKKRMARCEFTLRFSDAGGPELCSGPSAEECETAKTEAYTRR